MPEIDLHELATRVDDERSFVHFLEALVEDRADEIAKEANMPTTSYGPGPNGWANVSVEDFFESAARWAQDTYAQQDSFPRPGNAWGACALILYMGKIYE